MSTQPTEQRDLSALFPDPEPLIEAEGIALRLIDDDRTPAPGALRESMKRRGQLQPVILNDVGEDHAYQIVDGRRRIAAARALGWQHVTATVFRVDSLVESALAMTTNAVRSANPVSDLAAIEKLAREGYTEHDIAQATGLKVGTIRKRMKLLRLDPAIFDSVKAGKTAISTAERAASLPKERQAELAACVKEHGRITGDDVAFVSRVGALAAVSSLSGDLFGETTPDPIDHVARLSAALSDVQRAYRGSVDRETWMRLAEEAWSDE